MPPEIVNPYIIGLGGHARVVAGILLARGIKPAGFLDGHEDASLPEEKAIFGIPVLGNLSVLKSQAAPHVVVAIGNNVNREAVTGQVRRIAPAALLPALVHPTAVIEHLARYAAGVQICASAVLCADVAVGEGTIINTGASVDHEGRIGRFSHVSPGARLAGRVTVGDFTHIGIGAVVIEKIRIGHHVIVGAGAVVIRDVPDHTTVVGNPARILQKRT